MMVVTRNRPGLRLKECVRNAEITAQEALCLLIAFEPTRYTQTATYAWLLSRGAVNV